MTTKKAGTQAGRHLDIKINQGIIASLGRKLYQSDFFMVVLRELLQNSLDAQATTIEVTFRVGTLRVTDNGTGIQKIEGLLDTIGESIKDDSLETIGGYGLAKLAIFSCKEWEFLSISGTFKTGFLYIPDKSISQGTQVTCTFEDSDFSWDTDSKITEYLSTISRKNVTFFYNGSEIKSPEYKSKNVGSSAQTFADTYSSGYAVVRVNGLPTFKKWVSNLKETVFFDYTVTCSPYDKGYPLTSNRDGFLDGTPESIDLDSKIKELTTQLETDKKLAENIAKSKVSVKFRSKNYVSGGNITPQDYKNRSLQIATYERYIRQIADIFGRDMSECAFGLTDESNNELGMYDPSLHGFFISKNVTAKGQILEIAMHEFTHFLGYGMRGHDQNFASAYGQVVSHVLNRLMDGDFRK